MLSIISLIIDLPSCCSRGPRTICCHWCRWRVPFKKSRWSDGVSSGRRKGRRSVNLHLESASDSRGTARLSLTSTSPSLRKTKQRGRDSIFISKRTKISSGVSEWRVMMNSLKSFFIIFNSIKSGYSWQRENVVPKGFFFQTQEVLEKTDIFELFNYYFSCVCNFLNTQIIKNGSKKVLDIKTWHMVWSV